MKKSWPQFFVFVEPKLSDGGVSHWWILVFSVEFGLLPFSDCGDGFRLGDFGCYKIGWDRKSWHDAKLSCAETYGALVTIDSHNENEALETYLAMSIDREYIMDIYLCNYCCITYTLPAKNMEYFSFQRFCRILWGVQGIFFISFAFLRADKQILLLGI